jgi:hypothetical protein
MKSKKTFVYEEAPKKRKHFEDLGTGGLNKTTGTQQRERMSVFGKTLLQAIDQLSSEFLHARSFLPKEFIFEIGGEEYSLVFWDEEHENDDENCLDTDDEPTSDLQKRRLHATIAAMDTTCTSRNAYRELASGQLSMLREYVVAAEKLRVQSLIDEVVPIHDVHATGFVQNEDGEDEPAKVQGVYRSLLDVLPFVLKKYQIAETETLVIRVAGDGRNVGRKVKHVLVTFCLMNGMKKVMSSNEQYTVALLVGSEGHKLLQDSLQDFLAELTRLGKHGVFVNEAGDKCKTEIEEDRGEGENWAHHKVGLYFFRSYFLYT